PSGGRSRSAPWGACRPWWSTAAWSRRRGRRRRIRRPAWPGARSRTGRYGCRNGRCRWWLRRNGSQDPPSGPPFLSTSGGIVVVPRGAIFSVQLCPGPWDPDTRTSGPRRWEPLIAKSLSAQTESLDQRTVALHVVLPQVAEETTAATDEQQQATTAVVVVLVVTRVLGQVGDALREEGDLHLRGAGVALARAVLGHDLLLDVSGQRHAGTLLLLCVSLRGAPGLVLRCSPDPRPIERQPEQVTGAATVTPNRRGVPAPTQERLPSRPISPPGPRRSPAPARQRPRRARSASSGRTDRRGGPGSPRSTPASSGWSAAG